MQCADLPPVPTIAAPPKPARDILWLGCYSGNHDWQHIGGCNAGCSRWCTCSVPVQECAKCGDCDYGDNAEAVQVRHDCTLSRANV